MKQISIFLTTLIIICCNNPEKKIQDNNTEKKEILNPDTVLLTGWYYVVYEENNYKRQLDKDTTYYYLNPIPIVTAKNIDEFDIYESRYGDIGLSMKLDKEGTQAWSEATKKATGKQLAFIFNDKLLHVPFVNSQITGGMTALNRGVYSKEELENIMIIIEKDK